MWTPSPGTCHPQPLIFRSSPSSLPSLGCAGQCCPGPGVACGGFSGSKPHLQSLGIQLPLSFLQVLSTFRANQPAVDWEGKGCSTPRCSGTGGNSTGRVGFPSRPVWESKIEGGTWIRWPPKSQERGWLSALAPCRETLEPGQALLPALLLVPQSPDVEPPTTALSNQEEGPEKRDTGRPREGWALLGSVHPVGWT